MLIKVVVIRMITPRPGNFTHPKTTPSGIPMAEDITVEKIIEDVLEAVNLP